MTDSSRLAAIKESGRLPSPKGAALQVLNLCKKDDVTNQEVAHAIQADPALSARLIKLANSPLAHQVRPIVSVVDAVTVLGLNTVRQIVLGLSLVESSRNLSCRNFDYDHFWSHSLLRAIAVKSLASVRYPGLIPEEEIFVLGLLADVGSLALATVYPQEFSIILGKNPARSYAVQVELERAAFGFEHNQLSREMFVDWRMPNVFHESILHFEEPALSKSAEGSVEWKLLNLMHVADFFSRVCLATNHGGEKMMSKLVFKAAKLGVETDVLSTYGDKVVAEWHEWSALFRIKVVEVPPIDKLLESIPFAPDPSDIGDIPQAPKSHFKLRVLLADDERAILMVLKLLLDAAGHTVALAQNGIEALEKVREFKPQLIITDWMMPQMDGITFCRELRRNPEWRNIYVFILTALESTDRLVEAFEAGADDYMSKPINPRVLAARLSAAERMVQLQEDLEHEREQLQKLSDELAESNKRFQQLALTDELTGVYNRRFANEHLERVWAVAERSNGHLACMMLDIDYFKQVNDKYGHKTGDEALKQFAKTLKLSVRKQDVICRLGGEEFLLICPDILPESLERYAERIRVQVEGMVIQDINGKSIRMTVSIGAASKMASILSAEAMLQIADKRLYQAKERGRNCSVIGD